MNNQKKFVIKSGLILVALGLWVMVGLTGKNVVAQDNTLTAGSLIVIYQQKAANAKSKEVNLRNARTSLQRWGTEEDKQKELGALRDLYLARLEMYQAYLDWVRIIVAQFADEQGGVREEVRSLAATELTPVATNSTHSTQAAQIPPATSSSQVALFVSQKERYLNQLVAQQQKLADLMPKVGQINNDQDALAFAQLYQAAIDELEEILYPIYTFTILSELRQANFALAEAKEIRGAEVLANVKNDVSRVEKEQTLSQLTKNVIEINEAVTKLENSWQTVIDRAAYQNFNNQVKQLTGRMMQILQTLKGL